MLEAQADVREAPPSSHRDTDAQHGWVLDNFGINMRDPAHGLGGAVREWSAGAGRTAGGSALAGPRGDGRASVEAPHPTSGAMPGSAAVPGTPAAPASANTVVKIVAAAVDGFTWRDLALRDSVKTFETTKAHANYDNAKKPLLLLLNPSSGADATRADALIATVRAALVELERLSADVPRKAKAAADAAAKINGISDVNLHKISVAEKVGLVETLLAAGEPTGAVRDAQIKVYNAM